MPYLSDGKERKTDDHDWLMEHLADYGTHYLKKICLPLKRRKGVGNNSVVFYIESTWALLLFFFLTVMLNCIYYN